MGSKSFKRSSSSSSNVSCKLTKKSQWVCCQAHYDSRFVWLLLIQQSKPALKLLTEGAVTKFSGKAFHKLAARLKKKFSLCCCLDISLKYLKRWPLTWFWIILNLLPLSNLSILFIILYSWIISPLFLLSTNVVSWKKKKSFEFMIN